MNFLFNLGSSNPIKPLILVTRYSRGRQSFRSSFFFFCVPSRHDCNATEENVGEESVESCLTNSLFFFFFFESIVMSNIANWWLSMMKSFQTNRLFITKRGHRFIHRKLSFSSITNPFWGSILGDVEKAHSVSLAIKFIVLIYSVNIIFTLKGNLIRYTQRKHKKWVNDEAEAINSWCWMETTFTPHFPTSLPEFQVPTAWQESINKLFFSSLLLLMLLACFTCFPFRFNC